MSDTPSKNITHIDGQLNHDQLVNQLEQLHTQSWQWSLFCSDYHTEDAQDLLQEAYLQVLSQKATYLGKSTVKTWFFGVIRMLSYNHKRKIYSRIQRFKSYLHSFMSVDSWSLVQESSDPYENAKDLDDHQEIYIAIQQLSIAQRQVIELVFYQDLTLIECATVMQISIGSVRTHYARAKKKLAYLLKRHEVSA